MRIPKVDRCSKFLGPMRIDQNSKLSSCTILLRFELNYVIKNNTVCHHFYSVNKYYSTREIDQMMEISLRSVKKHTNILYVFL